jgi:hypothetical protein
MSLLFQRQRPEEFEVAWAGRAGDYLSLDLALLVQRYPPRAPSQDDMESLAQNGGLNRRGTLLQASGKTIQREQRLARGQCVRCPKQIGKGEDLGCVMCRDCRIKNVGGREAKQARRICARCHRRRREHGIWCQNCWFAVGAESIAEF